MRPLLVTASVATAALAGYLLFPMVANKVVEDRSNARHAAPSATHSDVAPAARESSSTASRAVPPPRPEALMTRPSAAPSVEKDAMPAPKKPTALRRKAKEFAAAPTSLPEAPTVAPTAYDPAGASKAPKIDDDQPRAARATGPLPNPLNARWIDDLSGRRARLSMGREKLDTSCTKACDKVEAPHDARVAGVVMKTERLVKSPTQPLEGKVKRGHFVENTPAVYVE